jgi:hypothetical protein
MIKMGSYLPLKIDGVLYPVKVGGYTGKTEPKVSIPRPTLTKLKRAIKAGDEAAMRQLESVVNATAVKDIQTAYMAWIPKGVVKQAGITTDVTTLLFDLPSGAIKVHVRSANKWLTHKTKGRTKPIAIVFGTQADKTMPFKDLSPTDIRAGLYRGISLLDKFTLSREPRKKSTTYYRKANNEAVVFGAQINPAKRWIVAEITPHGKKKLAGSFSTKTEAMDVIDQLYSDMANVKPIQWGVFQRVKVTNEMMRPFKGSIKVTRELHTGKESSSALGRSGEVNLPNPKRRTGRKHPIPKHVINPETGEVEVVVARHPGTSKTGEETNVKTHKRTVGKTKPIKL